MNDTNNNSWRTVEYYTVDEVSKILKLGKTKTYQLFSNEAFPSSKFGGALRVQKDAFIKWADTYIGREFKI